MARQPAAPKIPCPMSGKRGAAWGGYDQCEHCGKMVFIADRDSRYAKHNLPAEMARDEMERRRDRSARAEGDRLMTETETKVLHGMRQRAKLGLSAARADYLAVVFGLGVRETKDALAGLRLRGLVGQTFGNSFTPEWYLTTAGHREG